MKPGYIKALLFHHERTGKITDVGAKELFVACRENGIDTPDWLIHKISGILKKQVEDYKTVIKPSSSPEKPPPQEPWINRFLTDNDDIEFMLEVDQLLNSGCSQEEAIEELFPNGSFTSIIKKYRKLKKIYGDSPPEPIKWSKYK